MSGKAKDLQKIDHRSKRVFKRCMSIFLGLIFSSVILSSLQAEAAPTSLTYQGRILKSDGTPLEYNNVSFIFQLTDPSGQCVIYQEQVNGINMLNSAGVFDVPIGNGAIQFPLSGTATVLDAFNNTSVFTCGSCSSVNGSYSCANGTNTYAAAVGDVRKLHVSFYDGSGWKLITPDNTIRSVPFAGYALSAQKLGTNVASDFLLKAGLPTCTAGTFLSYNGSIMTCVPVAGASGGTVTNVASANSYLSIINNTSAPVLTVNVGTVANTLAAGNDPRLSDARTPTGVAGGVLNGSYPSPGLVDNAVTTTKISDGAVSTSKLFATPGVNRLVTTDSSTGATLTPLSCASGQVLTWNVGTGWQCSNQSSLAVGSAASAATATNFSGSLAGDVSGTQGATSVDKIKGVTLDFSVAPTNGQVLKFNGTSWISASAMGSGLDAAKPGTPATGDLFIATDTKKIYRYSGATWDQLADASSTGGITSLTSDVSATGPGSVSATVNSVGGKTAAAIATSVNDTVAATNLNTNSTIIKRDVSGNFKASNATLSATILNDNQGTPNTVTLQAPATVSANYILKLPTAQGSANQLMINDGSGNLSWTNLSTLGGVTSVTAAATAGNPITIAGSSTAPTVDIPKATSTTNGYLSSADWTTFSGKQNASLADGKIWVGQTGTPTAITPSGDLSMTNPGAFTVGGIQGKAVSATAPSSAGQVLRYDGANTYIPAFLELGDIKSTITPFGGAFISAACSASQTLYWQSSTDTFQCQSVAINDSQLSFTTSRTANTFLAAPNGTAGAATFRAIASADLPAGTLSGSGSAGYIPYYSAGATLANSPIFNSSGNVGIGTNTPSHMLTLDKTSALTSVAANTLLTLRNTSYTSGERTSLAFSSVSDGTPGAGISGVTMASSGGGELEFFTRDNFGTLGSRMYISGTGNVGIGTTTPGATLDIRHPSAPNGTNSLIFSAGVGTDATLGPLYFNLWGNPSATGTSRYMGIVAGDSETVRPLILNTAANGVTGNVGIGTTAPTTLLTIKQAGDTSLNSTPLQVQASTDDTGLFMGYRSAAALFAKDTVAIVASYISTGSYKPLSFSTSDVERVRIDTSGKVGIGTTSPTSTLDVNGKIRGTATYGYGSSSGTLSTSSTADVYETTNTATITVQNNDLVKVDLACNLSNSTAGAFTHMRGALQSGSATAVQFPNWITVSSNQYAGGFSTGLFRATADGTLTFQPLWHVSSGTGYALYCNLTAYVIGR